MLFLSLSLSLCEQKHVQQLPEINYKLAVLGGEIS